MKFGHPPTERPQSELAINKILRRDGAWHEAHLAAMESAPPRPHPFDFGSWLEYLDADDEWRASLDSYTPMDDGSGS